MTKRPLPPTTREILQASAAHIHGRTLDLGAGSAKYKPDILKHAASYTSYDMVPGPHIDTVGDVHALTCYQNASFDTVVCTEVLEHVQEPWRVIEEIARVLAPGGRCILTSPFLLPFHADPYDYYRYTVEGLSHLCRRTGMDVVDTAKCGNVAVVIAEAFKFAFCNPYVHKNPGIFRRTLFRLVYKFLCLWSTTTSQRTIFYAGTYVVAQKPLPSTDHAYSTAQ